ncbi:hypothetical protein [Alistipes sp.]|uniref:hypothetical protein n=1 Tax=Alistipes sp. TaxID=1872444 RepID=UPI0031FBBC59
MKNNRFSPQETARRKRAEEKTAQEMSRNRLIQLFCLLFFLKVLLFDLLWCLDTTFSSFFYPIAYLSKSILALLLTLPLVLRAPRWVEAVVALATDLFLVANLLYFRTYYTAIPLESYALAGNLRDFTASVTESLRWPDLLFPLSTAAALLAARRMPQPRLPRRGLVRYANALLLSSLLTAALLVGKGGFRRSYEAMLVHRQLSATTTYSLFGTLLYEALRERVEFTPELAGEVERWLAAGRPAADAEEAAEGLSAGGGSAAGEEATGRGHSMADALSTGSDGEEADAPRTGALADAPHAAHPDTGLKPHSAAQPGTDSSIGPDAHSPAPAVTRPSAHPATRPKTLPGDRRRVVVIFVESLESWVLERSVEGQELTPCLNRLLHEERTLYAPQVVTQVKGGRSIDAQLLVTTGLLPLENGCWSARCPHTAYPSLVKAFRQRHPGARALLFTPDKEIVWNQMIVITGDHEGLASERPALASSAAGRGLVSEGRFTPLIVVNAPAAMRCTDTVGQIDIYPTLLDLLGLDDYHWHGLGRSLLRADAPRAAVDPRLERVGAAVDSTTEQHLRQAWSLSDRIIRSDYFRHTGRE